MCCRTAFVSLPLFVYRSFSLILYSRATSGVSYRRLYVVMLVPPFFHTNTVLMRLACTMIVNPKV
jgi:hypothetical protein